MPLAIWERKGFDIQKIQDNNIDNDKDLVDSRTANSGTGIVQGDKGQDEEQVQEQVHRGKGGDAGSQQVIHRDLCLKPELNSPLLSLVSGVVVASKPACTSNCLS